MKNSSLVYPAAIVVLMLAAGSQAAHAQDTDSVTEPELYQLDFELGLEHSDNRARTSPPGSSETALVPRVILDLSRSGRRMSLRVAGDAEHRQPLSGPFGSDSQANLAGRLNWHLVHESLDWIVENVTSGSPLDLTREDTPENRQQTNVFSTGPRWALRPAAPLSGLFDARYIHSYAQDTDAFNSDRLMLAARALRRIAPGQTFSVGVEGTEVRYRDEEFEAADYERLDLVGRYRTTRAELDLDIAAGRSRIDLDSGEQLEGNLVRLRLAWTISDRNMLVASAGHELSDSVRQLAADIEQLDLPIASNRRLPIGNEFYVLDSLSLGWHYRFGRLDGSLTAGWRDYQFELDPLLDNEERGIALGLSWRLSPTMALQGELGLDRREFRDENRRDEDARASLFLARQFNPRWSGRVGAIRHERDSNIRGEDSRENILAVYLTYHAGY
ncbi:hypothetical protein [Wenzhouxiangella sp. EGI_FJ10305]|uniref:hypothetical protein n=1 Tax=Wenzhouxiangella sp. EGI_FJ10305 TaxID=3243768 RepID=UPI0035E1CA54